MKKAIACLVLGLFGLALIVTIYNYPVEFLCRIVAFLVVIALIWSIAQLFGSNG